MRSYVLVAYDISDPPRLRRVHKTMRGYGDPVQYSVFLCRLTEKDEVVLREKLRDIIHHEEDQVLFIRLGRVPRKHEPKPGGWTVLGRSPVLPDFSILIY